MSCQSTPRTQLAAAQRLNAWVACLDEAPDDNSEIPASLFTRRLPIASADLARAARL